MAGGAIKTRARHIFVDETTRFLEFIATKFPDCQSTKDMLLLFKNVMRSNDDKLTEMITSWYDVFLTPLLHKHVKYAKAIERYLEHVKSPQRTACLAHALAYRDVEAFVSSSDAQVVTDLDLLQKLKTSDLSDDDKNAMWLYMDDITKAACDALGKELPPVPSRAELSKYIKQKRVPPDTTQAVHKTFVVSMNALAESRGSELRLADDDVGTWAKRWTALSCEKADATNQPLFDLLAAGDLLCNGHLSKHIPELDWAAPLTKAECKLLSQVVSTARVLSAVPRGVMSEIEAVASKFAEELGGQSLENLSIDKIAGEISGRLSKLSERDIQSMMQSIDMLSPALQGLMRHA